MWALSKWVPGVRQLAPEETEAQRWEATWPHLSREEGGIQNKAEAAHAPVSGQWSRPTCRLSAGGHTLQGSRRRVCLDHVCCPITGRCHSEVSLGLGFPPPPRTQDHRPAPSPEPRPWFSGPWFPSQGECGSHTCPARLREVRRTRWDEEQGHAHQELTL